MKKINSIILAVIMGVMLLSCCKKKDSISTEEILVAELIGDIAVTSATLRAKGIYCQSLIYLQYKDIFSPNSNKPIVDYGDKLTASDYKKVSELKSATKIIFLKSSYHT